MPTVQNPLWTPYYYYLLGFERWRGITEGKTVGSLPSDRRHSRGCCVGTAALHVRWYQVGQFTWSPLIKHTKERAVNFAQKGKGTRSLPRGSGMESGFAGSSREKGRVGAWGRAAWRVSWEGEELSQDVAGNVNRNMSELWIYVQKHSDFIFHQESFMMRLGKPKYCGWGFWTGKVRRRDYYNGPGGKERGLVLRRYRRDGFGRHPRGRRAHRNLATKWCGSSVRVLMKTRLVLLFLLLLFY